MKPSRKSKSKLVCAVSVLLIILTVIAVISHSISRCSFKCECVEEEDDDE